MQQPLLVLPAVVDELHRIEDLLRAVPDIASAAALVARTAPSRPDDPADDLAEAVHKHLGLELDESGRGNGDALDLADLPHAANTILDTVRWRIMRVARAVILTHQARTVPQEEA